MWLTCSHGLFIVGFHCSPGEGCGPVFVFLYYQDFPSQTYRGKDFCSVSFPRHCRMFSVSECLWGMPWAVAGHCFSSKHWACPVSSHLPAHSHLLKSALKHPYIYICACSVCVLLSDIECLSLTECECGECGCSYIWVMQLCWYSYMQWCASGQTRLEYLVARHCHILIQSASHQASFSIQFSL